MMHWLKSLIGISGIQNRAGLSEEEVKLLKKDFSKLDKKASGISGRLLRYLLDGEGEEVLQELMKIKNAGSRLKLNCNWSYSTINESPARTKFFKTATCQDAAFWYRLAQVYDTASQTEARYLYWYGFQQGLEWLEVFLGEAIRSQFDVWEPQTGANPNFNAAIIEKMAGLAGNKTDALARGALFVDPADWTYNDTFLAVPGIGESFARHPATVIEALNQSHYQAKVYVLEMLAECKAPLEPFVEKIAELAVCSSKTVRAAAEPLLVSDPQTSRTAVEKKAADGKNEERYHAVRLLWKIVGWDAACCEFLEQRLKDERSKKVKQEIEHLLSMGVSTAKATASAANIFDLPPLEPVEPYAPLPPEIKHALHEVAKKHNEQVKTLPCPEEEKSQANITPGAIEKAFTLLQEMVIPETGQIVPLLRPFSYDDKVLQHFFDFALRSEMQLIHVIRLLVLIGFIRPERAKWQGDIDCQAAELIETYRKERRPNIDLRTLAVVFKAVGIDDRLISENILWNSTGFWKAEAVWPFFAERLFFLEEAFELYGWSGNIPEDWKPVIRENAFAILKLFPQLPEQFIPMLWDVALGKNKSERCEAQACLKTYPEKEKPIIAALSDGKKDVRATAAEWLGNLKYTEAVPEIEKALEKEKYEKLKLIMRQTLEKLGVPPEQFVNPEQLAEEARKNLKKGIPAKLSWFPFDSLPAVHWEKTGAKVEPGIVRWFLVQSFRLKNPEPGQSLRLHCSSFLKNEREALGKFVLENWIAEDTKPKYTHDEAAQLAQQAVQHMRGYVRQSPQYFPNWDEQKYFTSMLHEYLTACLGSAIPSKGVLAVAGACAGGDIVPAVDRYLKDWYGKRAAQCKALVQMMAWIDHPLAIQLLLSVGNRFRTKSIQEEAAKQVELLAQRKGWTLDELADRTIPAAGFDENGVLEIDYGLRKFYATLGEDFTIILTKEDGKQIKSLPNARKAEDPDIVKSAKKQLSAARKELKTVLKMQKERLYEAMCTQRTWHVEDWQLYLNQHPIIGRYCQRLVWAAFDGETLITSFRPLPDRSLTDHQDEEVTLVEHHTIRLAHDCYLTQEDRNAWMEHLSDYEVVPLFTQIGREILELSEEKKQAAELLDFQGCLISAFKLRSKATKLGYVRGEAEDAGWFYIYRKHFPGLRLNAFIQFTGNPLPEEDRTVALESLYFCRQPKDREWTYNWYGAKIQLGEIPPVLLAECWNDLRAIAAEGPGYDPDWKKKTEY